MDLLFPELMGGTVQGLNDAGVENFEGAIDLYLSRECGQNSCDAIRRDVDTARLEFERIELSPSTIPAFESIRSTLKACLERWGAKEKEKEFFTRAMELATRDAIPVLRIRDYGTTGLTGSDSDEAGRWFALVKSQGVSNKENTAGGSFGIGKSSPFAASRFRTVFYGTHTGAGGVALQGVSRLVTHKNDRGQLTQGVGFIGDYDPTGGEDGGPLFRAIREPERIPQAFRRDEPGTDIWVIGYRSDKDWDTNLTRSILTNFWPAIHRGLIEFRVAGQSITRNNLSELIRDHTGAEDFEANHYFKAIASTPAKKRLKHVGNCELYLTSASPDLPKRICMARNSGMRIFDYAPRSCRVPFSGLFICTDDDGNKLLRKLEPPRHDTWDPKRAEDGLGKRALDEIKGWIRDEVKKLNPLFGGKAFNEAELAKYLPDAETEEHEELPGDVAASPEEEGLEPRPRAPVPPPVAIKAKRVKEPTALPGEGGYGDTGEEGAGRHGEGTKGDRDPSGGGDANSRPPSLRVRSVGRGPGKYEVVLRCEEPFNGDVRLLAMGEDGTTEEIALATARFVPAGEGALNLAGNIIQGLKMMPSQPIRLAVETTTTTKRSLCAVPVR